MNVLITSINHWIQRVKKVPEFYAAQKDQLEALIRREISERDIQFISEEADPRFPTIAKQIADSQSPRIPWGNIVMTEEERHSAGIYDALQNRPVHMREDGIAIDHRIPEDHVREEFFMNETIARGGTVQNVLILCGDMHTEALAEKFRARGHTVDTNRSLCPDQRWASQESGDL